MSHVRVMDFADITSYGFRVDPRYLQKGFDYTRVMGLQPAIEALSQAQRALPKGVGFLVWDMKPHLDEVEQTLEVGVLTVELTLGDAHGILLDLGPTHEMDPIKAAPMYYEGRKGLTEDEVAVRDNRRILRRAMEFGNWQGHREKWHCWYLSNGQRLDPGAIPC